VNPWFFKPVALYIGASIDLPVARPRSEHCVRAAALLCPSRRRASQQLFVHRAQVVKDSDLSDLLEQADGALAYAVEALFDHESGE